MLGKRGPSTSMNQLKEETITKSYDSKKHFEAMNQKLPLDIYQYYENKVKERVCNDFLMEGPRL